MPATKYGPRSKSDRKQRSKNAKSTASSDSNVAEITNSETQNERMLRKQQMREAIVAEQSGQMSSKKKKRLDKYIENKLKKEEAHELLEQLAKSQSDTSFLRSSKHLSKNYDSGAHKKADFPLGPPIRRALATPESDSSEDEQDEQDDKVNVQIEPAKSENSADTGMPQPKVAVGSGLKRPLEQGLFGGPVIRKRQRTQAPISIPVEEKVDEVPWEGFSSDDTNEDGQSEDDRGESATETPSDSLSEDDDDDDDSEDESDDDEESSNLVEMMLAARRQKKAEIAPEEVKPKRDLSGFRSWATQQINEARDFAPNNALDEAQAVAKASKEVEFHPRAPEQDDLPAELQAPKADVTRKVYSVNVERPQDVQDARLKLPVVAEEQKIMEAIHNNPITIVCGATGSGKTTQIPQFLFEAGYGDSNGPTPGMIAITQPRRVAAVTMAKRVSQELGNAGSKVAYQIRYGSTVGKNTAMKFMTDGILIREIATDFSLSKYSAIVIDEAHERSVNTDILIGMLSRIVALRDQQHKKDPEIKPLKLVIMSATLMIKAFTENPNLFKSGTPPLVQSEGRQYPVTMHFARRTERDYLDETFKKIVRGHKKLPSGAILVFLTGESEIIGLSKKLKEAFGKTSSSSHAKIRIAASEAPLEAEDFDTDKKHIFTPADEDGASDDENEDEFDVEPDEEIKDKRVDDVVILPLYSKLPTKDQLRVFEPVPEGTRLIVLSTNVAETSVTIPGIRYVFDCGRSKEKKYDQNTGVQSFEIDWISKASAAQRAGRAGRTGPGHCYRLYSSAVYERDFADHTQPEILRMPVEGVVLQLKSMDLQHVVNFPFPTPPEKHAIIKAEKLLSYLGAIDSLGKVTPVGRDLSIYPLSPRFAKMLAVGHQQECMLLTIAMVAALATPELFIPENQVTASASDDVDEELEDDIDGSAAAKQKLKEYRRARYMFSALDNQADALKLLSAFAAYTFSDQTGAGESFCQQTFLRPKSLKEASQLFYQLLHIVAENRPGLVGASAKVIPKATEKQVKALKQIVAVGFIDQVAIRADLAPVPPDLPKGKRAIEVPYLTLFPSHEGRADSPEERAVYVHSSSILANAKVSDMPQYLIYSHLQRSSAATIEGSRIPKVRMHPLTSVTATQLTALTKGTPLLEYGKPIGKIEPLPGQIDKRVCWVVPTLVGQRGITAWPLPARKVIQKRGSKGTWEVEKLAT